MDNVYGFSDLDILSRIGKHLQKSRLKQDMPQQELARRAGVSLSTISRLEDGKSVSFEKLVRILRAIGKLEVLIPLVEDEVMGPQEYYKFVTLLKSKERKRASKYIPPKKFQADSTW
ncbi:MAG: helix-turn-helix transcriptional regulator [Bacteroidales bacterium]|nr:helix-turn-helix transcriptional regulator [Bacteroidales bacterium]